MNNTEDIQSVEDLGDGMFKVVHDKGTSSVPDNMNNRHRALIQEWEAIEGNEITPYEA